MVRLTLARKIAAITLTLTRASVQPGPFQDFYQRSLAKGIKPMMQTPLRFRSKRQLWTYSGLGLETRDRGKYHYVRGQVRRRKKQATIRGLNKDYNHDLKGLFKRKH
jgi:hypothetical protein